MEIDYADESNGSSTGTKENGLHLYPVAENGSGEGLPYAPEDFPNAGDKWGWKVGKRVAASGNFLDRYLYLPSRLQKELNKGTGFASKLSVQRFVVATFPGADVDAFFASFSWKIPSKKIKCNKEGPVFTVPVSEHIGCNSQFAPGGCKAGNIACNSLLEARDPPTSHVMACDLCCSEPGFCRDCCCILCSRTVTSAYGGYSFIRCEATNDEGFICGHIGHIECGLCSYNAGTVGGSIALDAEYNCRRCDARTDLVSHVTNFFQSCESIDSREKIDTILNICVGVLRGSTKTSAKRLLHHIEFVKAKLKGRTSHEDIWKMDDTSTITAGEFSQHETDLMEVSTFEDSPHHQNVTPEIFSGRFDYRLESLKLEDEFDDTLLALKKSQESEYRIAEDCLTAQTKYLLNLYQEIDKERCELASRSPSADRDALLDAVLERVDRIKCEVLKFRDMAKVADGFGKTSRQILEEHFSVETID